ncbi:unnamed protein product, partial [Prorocentrum cordatum]
RRVRQAGAPRGSRRGLPALRAAVPCCGRARVRVHHGQNRCRSTADAGATVALAALAASVQVLHGRHHSVLGDRVRHLGKPFREVVIHDSDQVYPEYLLMYSRDFVRRPATASRTASGSGP